MQHIIIGAGPAGVIAAETLRRQDPFCSITIISDEPELPYSRMAIPYYLIQKIGEEGTHLRKTPHHFQHERIELLQGKVEKVDTRQRIVKLTNGTRRDFDTLLIATGSSPLKPPVPGIDLPNVYNCWTLEDGRKIAAQLRPGAKILLLGAGFIGCIVLEALALRGVNLTVVEMGDRMVPRMMNKTAGNMIKQWCENKGVAVHTSTRVVKIESTRDAVMSSEPETAPAQVPPVPETHEPKGFLARLFGGGSTPTAPAPAPVAPRETPKEITEPLLVHLDNGEKLAVDMVISAAGVKPNIDFLQGSGIQMNRGILVDHHLQTNVHGIYAAGDVAEGRDFSTWNLDVHAIQPTASEHGRVAALNMTGEATYYRGSFNMNVLDTLGLISTSFGLWMGVRGGDASEFHDPDHFRYINLEFDGDILVGATTLGMTQHVGVLRGLIQNRVPLGHWKERLKTDPTRLMEAYIACTQPASLTGIPA
ncbi:NAD(P)/FAD-dependent oxidoreductase [Thioflexithrix psekupsensis]|uniref:FAD-dependent oxidoreductase n=1 Tax=Thioflexithrix psekupsensis TaxID=1570016 RepID=A0A251X8I8_9GAMM|nr:NAD(P)/FAD-dependent oxidoreductase [Thioflexithrix psekupsensis]OUD14291.1 FAD-dependent oxidoreductase [Thioflexithrix psekupsensis]